MTKFNVFLASGIIPCLAFLMACNSNTKPEEKPIVATDSVSIINKKFGLAFQNGDKIVASSIDTLKQISFGGATDPAISPDGKKMAYTVIDSAKHRTIWVADLENKSQLQLKVNSDNYYQAMWSPRGDKIAFNIFTPANVWKIGLINADNTGFIILSNTTKINAYSPTWKSESEILAHDLSNLYTFDSSGKIIKTESIAKLIGADYLISSSNRFFYTRDGKKLVFNAGTNEKIDGLEGPMEAVYILDLTTKKIEKISPNGMNVTYIFLTADDRIFYSGGEKPFTKRMIYISDLAGKIKKIVDHGDNPSGALQ
ncbi:hypothetical protein EZJ43_04165 [Pedobacter changchengzhani]|uniref:Dipeptidylpeptidase IV N-terminal domain-containing protein n=1 Tax=Pedobacter changchengzhani TaxID=2529274 RepID=A0A4R5MNE1_9SPHI|nr:PD40 domain-containing protein [Pedobacter changchengzhani]TDG37320.1 hypothetical protein EZJ43_04165 [Pedobacter changchengzhani]